MPTSIVRATTFSAVLLAGACAPARVADSSSPSPEVQLAAPSAAAGRYTFTSQFRGQSFEGVIRLVRSASGSYSGALTTPFTGELPVRSVDVQGKRTRVAATGQMGDAVLLLEMNGNSFSGTWSYGGNTGTLAGQMTPGT